MNRPSEYPAEETVSVNQVYLPHVDSQNVEQSSIFGKIMFRVFNKEFDGICVSPQCEIGKRNRRHYYVFCPLIPLESFIYMQLLHYEFSEHEIDGTENVPQTKAGKAKQLYKSFIKDYLGNRTHRYYFLLGDSKTIENFIIDFEISECLSTEDLKKYNKVKILRSPFREDVPTRYGSYISRIGTAPIPIELIKDRIDELNLPILSEFKSLSIK